MCRAAKQSTIKIGRAYNDGMKLSRRLLAQSLALGSAAAVTGTLTAQTVPGAAADNELDRARAGLRASVQVVRSVKLPMSTEPAVQFHAKG